jgi:hypothetical protein
MSATWQEAFRALEDFISNNKSVEISADVVCLPGEIRGEFYRLFDAVRTGFVKERYPEYIEEASELSRNFLGVKKRLTDRLGLEEIEISPHLGWFVNDPVNALVRVLFDPLFEVLKHKISLQQFESLVDGGVKNAYAILLREGYDRWVTLALAEALSPDLAFNVPVADQRTEPELNEGELHAGAMETFVPPVERATRWSFNHTPFTALLVPKAIVHSATAGCYVSLCTDYHYVYRRARTTIEGAKWLKMAAVWRDFGKEGLWPDLGIYLDTDLDQLAFIADYNNILMPDIMVEYMEKDGWYENGGVEAIIKHFMVTKPRFGGFIVCREPVPENVMIQLKPPAEVGPEPAAGQEKSAEKSGKASPAYIPLPDEIQVLVVGYDENILAPITARITEGCSALKSRNGLS